MEVTIDRKKLYKHAFHYLFCVSPNVIRVVQPRRIICGTKAPYRDKWKSLTSTFMTLPIPQNAGIFVTTWGPVILSWLHFQCLSTSYLKRTSINKQHEQWLSACPFNDAVIKIHWLNWLLKVYIRLLTHAQTQAVLLWFYWIPISP